MFYKSPLKNSTKSFCYKFLLFSTYDPAPSFRTKKSYAEAATSAVFCVPPALSTRVRFHETFHFVQGDRLFVLSF